MKRVGDTQFRGVSQTECPASDVRNRRLTRGSARAHRGCGALALHCVALPAGAAPALVKDINETIVYSPSNPAGFANLNGTLYFLAGDEVHGRELWKSDGTPSGTVMVKDINPGAAPSRRAQTPRELPRR